MHDKHQLPVYLDEGLYKRLRIQAAEEEISMSKLIQKAVAEYLTKIFLEGE